MSGSGPSESARHEGEQPVEGVRNPEDGRCRTLDGPGDTDLSADVAEGARNPRRGDPVRQDRRGHLSSCPERDAKPAGVAHGLRVGCESFGGRPRGRGNDGEGAVNR
jgi:hypothetical protein